MRPRVLPPVSRNEPYYIPPGAGGAGHTPILLCAGGVCSSSGEALGQVPGHDEHIDDVHEWVDALNSWYHQQLAEWEAVPRWAGNDPSDLRSRGGHALLNYAVPTGGQSVVLSRHLRKDGMPQPPPEGIAARLNAYGIRRVVVGHTPHGNCPTVIKTGRACGTGPCLEVVMADTSYSNMKEPDNRGAAVSDVVLRPDGSARVHGRLHDGVRVEYELGPGVGPDDELIGLHQPGEPPADGPVRFVKAWLPDKRAFLFCTVNGFKTEYMLVPPAEARALVQRSAPELRRRPSEICYHAGGDEVCVGRELSDPDNKERLIEHIFERIDKTSDGVIVVSELRAALCEQPAFLKLLQGTGNDHMCAEELLRQMDLDKSGTVSMPEFKAFILQKMAHCCKKGPKMAFK